MSQLVSGTAYRTLLFGLQVAKSAAVLPDTAYGALFTVSGGRVIILGIVGEVTTVMDATATTLKFTSNPTTGTDTDLSAAVAVTSKEVGSLISTPIATGGDTIVTNAGGGVQLSGSSGFVVPEGNVGVTTSATQTGAASWVLHYVPLDAGAEVVSA